MIVEKSGMILISTVNLQDLFLKPIIIIRIYCPSHLYNELSLQVHLVLKDVAFILCPGDLGRVVIDIHQRDDQLYRCAETTAVDSLEREVQFVLFLPVQ